MRIVRGDGGEGGGSVVTTLTIEPNGAAEVTILDAKRKPRNYAVSFPASDEFAVVLDRLDGEGRYAIVRLGPAEWRCSCANATYKHGRGRYSACKHIEAVRPLFELSRAIKAQSETIAQEAS